MQTTSGRIHISFPKQIILQRKTFSLYNNIYTNLPYAMKKKGGPSFANFIPVRFPNVLWVCVCHELSSGRSVAY